VIGAALVPFLGKACAGVLNTTADGGVFHRFVLPCPLLTSAWACSSKEASSLFDMVVASCNKNTVLFFVLVLALLLGGLVLLLLGNNKQQQHCNQHNKIFFRMNGQESKMKHSKVTDDA
jgi:hypothetical protein